MKFYSIYTWLNDAYSKLLDEKNSKRAYTVVKWTLIAAAVVIACGLCTIFVCVDPLFFTLLALVFTASCTALAVTWLTRTREAEQLGYSWRSPLQSLRNFYENHKEGIWIFGFALTAASVKVITKNIYLTAIIMAGASGIAAILVLRENHKGILIGIGLSTVFLLFLTINSFIPFGFLGFFILVPGVILLTYNAGFQLESIISDIVELIKDIFKGQQKQQPELQPVLQQLEQPHAPQETQKPEETKDLKESKGLEKPNIAVLGAQTNGATQVDEVIKPHILLPIRTSTSPPTELGIHSSGPVSS